MVRLSMVRLSTPYGEIEYGEMFHRAFSNLYTGMLFSQAFSIRDRTDTSCMIL